MIQSEVVVKNPGSKMYARLAHHPWSPALGPILEAAPDVPWCVRRRMKIGCLQPPGARASRLSQNLPAVAPPHWFAAETAAERRQIIARGASPRSAGKSGKAPEGRQKPLLFNRFLSPFQGFCT